MPSVFPLNLSTLTVGQTGALPVVNQTQAAIIFGSWLEVVNETYGGMLVNVGGPGRQLYLPAGWQDYTYINPGDDVTWSVVYIGVQGNYSYLTARLYTPGEIPKTGLYRGPVKPAIQTIPLAALGGGTLPAGIQVSPSQVQSGLFNFGTNEPASNVIAGVMNNGIIVAPLLADGSIPANCNLQSDGVNGNLAVIGGRTTQGRGVPLQEQSKLDQLISATTLTTILTYTPPVGGEFRVSGDFTINSASTGITFQVTYTNRNGTATTSFFVSGTTIMNVASLAAGTFPCASMSFTATAAPITISFRDSVLAGADHVSAYLEWLD